MFCLVNTNTKKTKRWVSGWRNRQTLPITEIKPAWVEQSGPDLILQMPNHFLPKFFHELGDRAEITYQLGPNPPFLQQIWPSGIFSDLSLIVEDKVFTVHKVVLATSSPYFYALFTQGKEEGQSEIVLLETSHQCFQTLLDLLYHRPININGLEMLRLLIAAQKYHITIPLMNQLSELIKIPPEDVLLAVQLLDKLYPLELGRLVDQLVFSVPLPQMKEIFPMLPSRFQTLFGEIYDMESVFS